MVLATDIAETSLTVAGVRIVVDSGQVRSPRFDARSGLTRLETGPTSRASSEQRAGRAGRTEPGVAYRLWSEAEHRARRAFAPPEIAVVDLAGLALELAEWGADAADLPFLDPPPHRAMVDARSLLTDLGALGPDGRITETGRAMVALPVHPRLARMIVMAATGGDAAVACALAALLEERDVLRAPPDARSADIEERLRLVLDPAATHAEADARAVALVRRRAQELQRRIAPDLQVPPGRTTRRPVTASGPVLALAYPDRLAQARGDGRFRLRNGTSARLRTGDALSGEPFLVVAELDVDGAHRDGDHVIRLAAALDREDVERTGADAITDLSTLRWDDDRDDLRSRTERRLGALVLAASEGPARPGPATTEALVDRVRRTRLGALTWSTAARTFQARVRFARRGGGDWPDLSDAALLESIDEWLAPRLTTASGRADLARIDVLGVLHAIVGHHRLADLDRLVPRTLAIGSGREVPIDYGGDTPAIAVRVQDLFGTTVHPTIALGRIPIAVTLLSPAGRPVQVTSDLPGFWNGTWADVRKEMAGRYPKHPWPTDPATATPPARRPPRPR